MMRLFTVALGCGLAVLAQAEPAHHSATAKRGVDLEAAARATAALYANMAAPAPAPAPATATVAAPSVLPAPRPAAVGVTPVPTAPRQSPLLPPAPAQTAVVASAAGEVWEGAYHCEHAEKVQLRPDAAAGQVELQWKGQRWKMRRIDSLSGAMRLEDATARMVWIQLANKSMLLDQRQGRRLLDECQHDVQVQTAAQMKINPPPALFDTTGMGR